MKSELIFIVSQAFYGNRTGTEISREEIDRFILGHQSNDIELTEPVDRTIIHLPGSDNLVLIYNKYQDAKWMNDGIKPLASIPEMNLDIYGRCIVCRMNAAGEFESLCEEDDEVWGRYLAR